MLVTLNEIIAEAEKASAHSASAYSANADTKTPSLSDLSSSAVGAFNTTDLESVIAVIAAAEELSQPVILAHAEIHSGILPLEIIGPVMLDAAKRSKVPVCVHLDHGGTLSYIEKALEMGFTSVMFDGSALDYEKNCEMTRKAADMAHKYGASAEGELGVMKLSESSGGDEGHAHDDDIYTNPEQAADFCKRTGIDALACAFGTVHGVYTKTPKLDFDRLREIGRASGLPLVMHGGSGVSDGDYRRAIECGIRKINYYTYLEKAGFDALAAALSPISDTQSAANADSAKTKKLSLFNEAARIVSDAMKRDAMRAMRVFSGR